MSMDATSGSPIQQPSIQQAETKQTEQKRQQDVQTPQKSDLEKKMDTLRDQFLTVGLTARSSSQHDDGSAFDLNTLLSARRDTGKYKELIKGAEERFGKVLNTINEFKATVTDAIKKSFNKLDQRQNSAIDQCFKKIATALAKHETLYDKETKDDDPLKSACTSIKTFFDKEVDSLLNDLSSSKSTSISSKNKSPSGFSVANKATVDANVDDVKQKLATTLKGLTPVASTEVKPAIIDDVDLKNTLETHILLTNERTAQKEIRKKIDTVFDQDIGTKNTVFDEHKGAKNFEQELRAAVKDIENINTALLTKEKQSIKNSAKWALLTPKVVKIFAYATVVPGKVKLSIGDKFSSTFKPYTSKWLQDNDKVNVSMLHDKYVDRIENAIVNFFKPTAVKPDQVAETKKDSISLAASTIASPSETDSRTRSSPSPSDASTRSSYSEMSDDDTEVSSDEVITGHLRRESVADTAAKTPGDTSGNQEPTSPLARHNIVPLTQPPSP